MASLAHMLPGFNAYEETDDDFGAIPKGDYVVVVVGSGMKPTKAGTGQYLEVVMEVIDGQYKGRSLWGRLNLVNPSETATKIARKEWAQICRAVGIASPADSSEVHNKPMIASVKVVPGTTKEQNEIEKYSALTGVPGQQAPAQPAQVYQAPAQPAPVYQQPAQQPVYQAPAQAAPAKAPWQ